MEEKEMPLPFCGDILRQGMTTGFVSIRDISRLGMNAEVSEDDVIRLLSELKDNDIAIVIDKDQLPDKELLKKVRSRIKNTEQNENRSRYEDPLKLYFDDLMNTEVLSESAERDLIYDAADGDEGASEALIESSLFIPAVIAYEFIGKGVRYMDMVQEGNVEIVLAASEFDYQGGMSFYGYIAYRVAKRISEVIDEAEPLVTLPNELSEDAAKVLGELNNGSGSEPPAPEQLSEKTGVDIGKVRQILDIVNGKNEEQDEEIAEPAEAEEELPQGEEHQLSAQIEEMLSVLGADEREVIKLRFGLGHKREYSVEETAEMTGRSIERVRSLEESGKKKLGMI